MGDGAEEAEGVPDSLVLGHLGGDRAQLEENVQVTAGEAEAARRGLVDELVEVDKWTSGLVD